MIKNYKLIYIVVAVLFFISPLHFYSKWHLKTFETGAFYTLFNVTYIPHDYKRPVWKGFFKESNTIEVEMTHEYKGLYEIWISGEIVKNKDLKFMLSLSCNGLEPIIFRSENVLATDLFRKSHSEINLGSYNVSSGLLGTTLCKMDFEPENFSSSVFITVMKKTHW